MELFLQNIPPAVDRIELIRALEPVLHGEDFRHYYIGGAPFNFEVKIFKNNKRGYHHYRCGKLIVPTEAIGTQVLSVMYLKPFQYDGRCITFQESKFPAKKEELALLKGPYIDPEILEEQLRREKELDGVLKVKSVRFGWPCHDGTISIEWESPPGESWTLAIDDQAHRLILKSRKNVRIVIALRAIQSTTLDITDCVYWLERPPAFEKGPEPVSLETSNIFGTKSVNLEASNVFGPESVKFDFSNIFGTIDIAKAVQIAAELFGPEIRNRLHSLDPANERLFSFLRVVSIIFDDHSTASEYRRKARMIGLSNDAPIHRYAYHKLFDQEVLKKFDDPLKAIPFEIAFQMEGLVSRRRFNPKELLEMERSICNAIEDHGDAKVRECLKGLDEDREEKPEASVLELFGKRLQKKDQTIRNIPSHIFQCHRIMLTPTSAVLNGPFPDETNRVLRRYIEHQSNFLRVEIRDEDGLKLRWDREVDGNAFLDKRFGSILKNGCIVAGQKFEFLGYSTSALREHAIWFMSPFKNAGGQLINADFIVRSLGDFSKVIHFPARYGARIAQAFSGTEPSVTIKANELKIVKDKISPSGLSFTDGVGTASRDIFEKIWELYKKTRSRRNHLPMQPPSAFQIRMGGAKGVLCVDEELDGRVVHIRDSMHKFASEDREVEICSAFDKPLSMYLNQPLIMLLETLGVPLEPFMELQNQAVEKTRAATKSFADAAKLLQENGLGTAFNMASLMLQFHKLQLDLSSPHHDEGIQSFLGRAVKYATNHVLRDIKYKARIPIPEPMAWTLVGVADEYDYLEEDEIYAYVCTPNGLKKHIEGPVLISRSPTVHPGDARMVRAIGEPPLDAPEGLKNLTNCVVFNCKGDRPLPSQLAGGDLDGDIYCLILDERLHPRTNYPPASPDSLGDMKVDLPSTSQDVAQFVVDYIKNDLLGVIATQLLITADLSEKCMSDPDCLALAALHSMAVDFPKTGRPAPRSEIPKPKTTMKPDWYANETSERKPEFYPSERHLGHLFRAIELPAIREAKRSAQRRRRLVEQGINSDFEPKTVESRFSKNNSLINRTIYSKLNQYVEACPQERMSDLLGTSLDLFGFYSQELVYICKGHSLSIWTPLSEEEVVAGTIVAQCSQPRMRNDRISAMRRESTILCSDVRESVEGPEDADEEEKVLRGWAAFKVATAFEDAFGAKSFGLIALMVVFGAIRKIEAKRIETDDANKVSSVQNAS